MKELTNAELKLIVREGLKSPFWELLKERLEDTKKIAMDRLTRGHVRSMDACIQIANYNAIYKTAEELVRWPESILASIAMQEEQLRANSKTKPEETNG